MKNVMIGEYDFTGDNIVKNIGYVCEEVWDRINRVQNGLEKHPDGTTVFVDDFNVCVGAKCCEGSTTEVLYERRVAVNHRTQPAPEGSTKFFKLL